MTSKAMTTCRYVSTGDKSFIALIGVIATSLAITLSSWDLSLSRRAIYSLAYKRDSNIALIATIYTIKMAILLYSFHINGINTVLQVL